MNIIYDTQSTINENINLRLNGLRPRSEASEELKNLNGKWIQICMRGFRPFSGSPGLRAGPGAADFLHVRHPIPQSRFASVGECKPRSRSWPWSWRGAGKSGRHGSMFALSGPEGVRPRPGRVVGKQGWPGASRSGATRARVCRIKRVSVCPAAGEGSRMPIRVSVGPKAGERMNAGTPSACLPAGKCGGLSPEPRRRLAGKGRLLRVRALCRACPQKMKGAPKGSLPHQKLTLKNYPLFGRPP